MENPAEIAKLRDEQSGLLIERYKAVSGSSRKHLTLLVIFGLAFQFFVLLPAVAIRERSRDISSLHEQRKLESDSARKELGVYQPAHRAIQSIRTRLKEGPGALRAHLGTLQPPARLAPGASAAAESPGIMGSVTQAGPGGETAGCPGAATLDDWARCEVRGWMTSEFAEYDSILRRDLLPLQARRKLPGRSVAALEGELAGIRKDLSQALERDPDFWRTYEGKGRMFLQMSPRVDSLWGRVGSFAEAEAARLKSRVDTLRDSVAELRKRMDGLATEEKQVEARITQLEFPFGKLPVGLGEALGYFPVLLALGFLACAAEIAESMRLGVASREMSRLRDPAGVVLTPSHVHMVIPLWLDPEGSKAALAARLAVLLLPLAILVVSCIRVMGAWDLFDDGGALAMKFGTAVSLYVLSFLVLAGAYYLLWRTYRDLAGGAPGASNPREGLPQDGP